MGKTNSEDRSTDGEKQTDDEAPEICTGNILPEGAESCSEGSEKAGEMSVKKNTCPECSKTFKYVRHLYRHMFGHKKNNCQYCDTLLASRKQLLSHMAEKHKDIVLEEGKYGCDFCDKLFVKRSTLYKHYLCHANGRHVCQHCGMFFDMKEEYDNHQLCHEQEMSWHCDVCKKGFFRRQQYMVHMAGHKKYKCSMCLEDFATKAVLVRHESQMHNLRSRQRTHKCPQCDQAFTRPSLLKIHLCSHSGELPVRCKPCGKSFCTRQSYSMHLKSTLHQKCLGTADPQQTHCTQCGEQFAEPSLLAQHVACTHHSSTELRCALCDHVASGRANLSRHIALHLDGRQFICEQCGAAFHSINNLRDHHTYLHSQARHFSCDRCGSMFKRNSELNRHMRTHSEDRPYSCHCGQSYKRISHLRRHAKSAHGTVVRRKRIQRLVVDDSGALVPVRQQETKAQLKQNVAQDSSQVTLWAGNSKDRVIMSLIDPGADNISTVTELCIQDPNLPTSDELPHVSVIQHTSTAKDIYKPEVTHTIEVSYDLDFPVSETISLVPDSDSSLVFSVALPVSLPDSHTVFTTAGLTTHESSLEVSASEQPRTLKSDGMFAVHNRGAEAELLSAPSVHQMSVSMLPETTVNDTTYSERSKLSSYLPHDYPFLSL